MFRSFLSKISEVTGSAPQQSGEAGSTSSGQIIGSSKLTKDNSDWADVYNHYVGQANTLKGYVKGQQHQVANITKGAPSGGGGLKTSRKNEGCIGDYDPKVAFRAEASVGTPCPSAKAVAYDTVRQLVAVLGDSPSLTLASAGAAAATSSLATTAPSVVASSTGGSCVFIFGSAGAHNGASPLQKTVLLRDNEDWEEMIFAEGYDVLVLRSERMLCFVDTRSSTNGEAMIQEEYYTLPLFHESTRLGSSSEGPFTCGSALPAPPPSNSDESCSLTTLCKAMPVGLGMAAVGTSDGRVLFAPLFPPTIGTPYVWSKTQFDIKLMLSNFKAGGLGVARNATINYYGAKFSRLRKREVDKQRSASLPQEHLLDAVQCIVSYPSDPNTYLTSTRNSHGVAKWYAMENRISAMFLLPHCFGTKGPATTVNGLGHHFERTYVTAAAVTAGGGSVLGITNNLILAIWQEQDNKTPDKFVPPSSAMNLLLSHPMASRLATISDNQSGSDATDEEEVAAIEAADYAEAPSRTNDLPSLRSLARDAHKILLSKPDTLYLLNTVAAAAYNALTETASSVAASGGIVAPLTPSALAPGSAPQKVHVPLPSPASPFLTLFVPTQQVQYSGSSTTSVFATEHAATMTEVRIESTNMSIISIRHVPVQGFSGGLTFGTHTKARKWENCIFNKYPIRLSTVAAVPGCPWPSERVCGLLLNAGAIKSPQQQAPNSRLSVTLSGGVGDAAFRGSIRGSVVMAETIRSLATGTMSGEGMSGQTQALMHLLDLPPPLAPDGSPACLASFLLAATQQSAVQHSLSTVPETRNEVVVSLRTTVGSGASVVHRVVERLLVMEEEEGEEGCYYNASYRSVPITSMATESFVSPTHKPITPLTAANQLVLFKALHRRLLYDSSEALRARRSGGGQASGVSRSSTSLSYLMGGGAGNPFTVNGVGEQRKKKPYYPQNAEDTGLLGLWQAAIATDCIGSPSPTPLWNMLRLYPFSNMSSLCPSTSTLQLLAGPDGTPPLTNAKGPSPIVEKRIIGTQKLFEGTMVMSLIERREYVLPAEGLAEGQMVSAAPLTRCRVSYALKTLTQRSLNDDADSDAENEAYETIVAVPQHDKSSTTAAHNQAMATGVLPIPYLEALAPTCVAGFSASLIDAEGCILVPTPESLGGSPDNAKLVRPSVPTVVAFKVVYGRLLQKVAEVPASYGPQRLFSPNEGLSVLLALSDNTVIIMPVNALVAIGEQLVPSAALPESCTHVPGFLFPSQTNIRSVDVFSLPVVVPVAWGTEGPQKPAASSPTQAGPSPACSSFPVSSAFAAAHILVLAAGLSDGSVLLFDTCRGTVLSCTPLSPKGSNVDGVISIAACTPANGTYSYAPAADEVDAEHAVPEKQPASPQHSSVALITNPFAPQSINRPNLLHEAVFEALTVPGYGGTVPLLANKGPTQRPMYHWYPRSCLSRIPPQIPVGFVATDGSARRGQAGASIGGCNYLKMEVVFAGGMTNLGELLGKFWQTHATASSNATSNVRIVLTAQLLDVFGFPLCGVEVGTGLGATAGGVVTKTLFVRVADTHLLPKSITAPWQPIPPESLAANSGIAITREFDTGLAVISLIPVPSAGDDMDVPPEVVFSAKMAPPLAVRVFNSRRVSCVNIITAPSSTPALTFSSTQGSNVGVEVVDAIDDTIRLFGVDMMPMPSIGGSLPLGCVASGDVASAVNRNPKAVPARARVPQLPSLHDFPLSKNFTSSATVAQGTTSTANGRPQTDLVVPSQSQLELLQALFTHCSGSNPKSLLAALEAALEAANTSYPMLMVTLASKGSKREEEQDISIGALSLKQTIQAIQAASIQWVRAYLLATYPQQAQAIGPAPSPPGIGPIPFAAQSLRSLLAVAVRHNNMCEKMLGQWAVISGGAEVSPSRQLEVRKVGFEERMRRIEKGLPPDPVDVATHNAVEGTDYEGGAMRTIARLYRGANQSTATSVTSTRCPYTDFLLPNVVASFSILSTSSQGHDPDELVAVRLGERVDAEDDTFEDDADDDGLAPLSHVPAEKQRPFAFVSFTTQTSPTHEYRDAIADLEEGLYGHQGLLRPSEEGTNVGRKGIARQGGPYRSHIAVFDLSIAAFEVEGQGGKTQPSAPFSSLSPLFIFPIPSSTIPSTHIITGFDVCWVQGQAHCYMTSAAPAATVIGGVHESGKPAAYSFRHGKTHHLSHVVLDDGTDDLEAVDSSDDETDKKVKRGSTAAQAKKPKTDAMVRQCPPTQLLWEGTGMRTYNPFTVCDFMGQSLLNKRDMEMSCLQRAHKAAEAARAGTGKGSSQQPHKLSKDIIGFRLPPPPSNLAATQKEQGFFKRVFKTTSYADQVEKVERSSLSNVAEVDFNAFFANTQSAALRNLTPAEKRAMLLRADTGAGRGKGQSSGTANAKSGINETKVVMNENLQLLHERGEKIDRLKLKTKEMHEEAATFADLAAQLKAKKRSRWI